MDRPDFEKLLAESERQRELLREKLAQIEVRFNRLRDWLQQYCQSDRDGLLHQREKLLSEWEESLKQRERDHEKRLEQLLDQEQQDELRRRWLAERSQQLDEREQELAVKQDEPRHWWIEPGDSPGDRKRKAS